MTTWIEHKNSILLTLLLSVAYLAQSQCITLDFEAGYTDIPDFLKNLNIVADSNAYEGTHVCLCDSIYEYGIGFEIDAAKEYPKQNIAIKDSFWFKIDDTLTQAKLVFSIDGEKGNAFWQGLDLINFRVAPGQWSEIKLDLHFPIDYLHGNKIKGYIWNPSHNRILIDHLTLEIEGEKQPSYQPDIEIDSLIIKPFVEYINAKGDTLRDLSIIESHEELVKDENGTMVINTEATFKEDVKLLRLAYIMPLPEGKLTVYRRNQHVDTSDFQNAYYLDREGFMIQTDSITFATYHNTGISSLQIDTEKSTACFNIDYWRDHPLIHYPLDDDTLEYFEDISYRNIKKGEVLKGNFTIYCNHISNELPRIMPVWDGYESVFIFTEHADWTDLSTHRAVLFGNENITQPDEAVGGFVYFNIPVTKSVFYNNPDQITNAETSKGHFDSPIETIKTDKEFYKLLKILDSKGFDICLHTPEIYTTERSNLKEALRFMRRKFGSPSWIDHGYNNTSKHNREDLVCDALLPDSPQYAFDLWKQNKVRYLWNAYYEENQIEQYHFDGHFIQPYDGFGDALPNRQITTLPNDDNLLLWATSSTLEVNEDHEWYYFFSENRLQHIVNQHKVFITHTYPAWSDPWRGFWEYNENETAVAMPGFNFALQQIANLREAKKMLPTTISQYLDFYEKLQNISYEIEPDGNIRLTNNGDDIKGLTLICTQPITVENKPIDFRRAGDEYLIWFDLDKYETTTIRFRQ